MISWRKAIAIRFLACERCPAISGANFIMMPRLFIITISSSISRGFHDNTGDAQIRERCTDVDAVTRDDRRRHDAAMA